MKEPRSDRRCRGFAPQSERQGLVTGLSPSMSGDGRSSCPSIPRLAHPPTEHHPKRRTRGDRPGSEHLRSEHFGIPSWLVPCVHDDVKDLLGRSRDVDHGDRRPGRAPLREPGGQTRWQSDSEHRWKQQRVTGSRWQPLLPMSARVRRDGQFRVIDASQLVRGDLVVLRPRDRISADLTLTRSRAAQ